MRVRPPEYGMISTQARTFAPSSVIRRAIIRPISPEPRISTRLPTIKPSQFKSRCAVPAVKIPAGLVPGVPIAPRVLSRHPIARTIDFAS